MQRRHNILVIEDNEINREILREILKEDFELLFAENGEVGMELLHANFETIDIVLLDIEMPVMNGYQVLEAMRKEPLLRDIPVIVTTGNDDEEDEIRCLKLGATDFVRKPYSPVIVHLRIDSILRLKESDEANRQKTVFIQNISHEIRTPMNAIMGFSEILGDTSMELDGDERHEYVRMIETNSHALMDMIENMMVLSNADGLILEPRMTDVKINRLCRTAIKKAEYYRPESVDISFTTELEDTAVVSTDSQLLQRAILNHLANACKFTREGHIDLHCSWSEQDGKLVFTVTDTGKGVPPEAAEEIYTRFLKLDSFVPGAGVGLSASRTIATLFDGRSYLDTSYDARGSRFVFEIPANNIRL